LAHDLSVWALMVVCDAGAVVSHRCDSSMAAAMRLPSTMRTASATSNRLCWWLVLLLALCAAVALDIIFGFHELALQMALVWVDFFHARSIKACLCYTLLYVTVSLACIPLTPFEILTGFCFGIPLGIVLDIIGRIAGALLSFLIARFLSSHGLDCRHITGNAVLKGVGRAVEEQGFRFLVLFNLAYVPVAVKNYGLGFVPGVPLLQFVASIFVIEVPIASVWASIGSAAASEFKLDGVSFTNITAVEDALSSGAASDWRVKVPLLILGVGAIFFVLSIIHGKVSAELKELGMEEAHAPLVEEGVSGAPLISSIDCKD